MSSKDITWIVAVATIPTTLFLCTAFICIVIEFAIKKWKRGHPAICDVDTPPRGRQQAVVFPVFAAPLQINIVERDPPPPYNYQFAQPSNEPHNGSVAMGTPPQTPPPLYEESVSTHETILTV